MPSDRRHRRSPSEIQDRITRLIKDDLVPGRERRSEDNHFEGDDVVSALVRAAAADPTLLDLRRWAQGQWERFDVAHRQKLEQTELFPGETFIPDGEGKRIRYTKATRDDVVRWMQVDTKCFDDQAQAFQRKSAGWQEILEKFDSPAYAGCKTVGDLNDRDGIANDRPRDDED